MPLQCNIDARGKLVRLIYGVILVLLGIGMLIFWALRWGGAMGWIVSGLVMAMGAFAIFESRKGWCVVRAMGIKTPI